MQVNMVVTVITENEKDSRFHGEVTVSGSTYLYELNFLIPIENYMDALRGKTTEEFRKAISIQIRTIAEELELENDEWRLFYYVLMPTIVEIHNKRVQLQHDGHELAGGVLVGGGLIRLEPEAVDILSRAKFGCQLMDDQQKSN